MPDKIPTTLPRADLPAVSAAVTPAPMRALTAPEFQRLAEVPPAAEWFAKIGRAHV